MEDSNLNLISVRNFGVLTLIYNRINGNTGGEIYEQSDAHRRR